MRRHIFSEQLDEYIREHWYEQEYLEGPVIGHVNLHVEEGELTTSQ
jgi:hypothetical protein